MLQINNNNNNNQKQQNNKLKVNSSVRVELTTLALSAPRSADGANRPTADMQLLK